MLVLQTLFVFVRFFLQANRTIRSLSLHANQIGDAGIRALIVALSALPTFDTLTLDQNQITATGAALLGAWLQSNRTLTHLSVGGNSMLGDAGVVALAEGARTHSTLSQLHLWRVGCGDACIGPLVTSLRLGQPNAPLRVLNLTQNRIGDAGAAQLATALPTSPLRTLLLSGNSIHADGACALAHALKSCRSLRQISLHQQRASSSSSSSSSSKGNSSGGQSSALMSSQSSSSIPVISNLSAPAGIGERGLLALGISLLANEQIISLDGDERWPASQLSPVDPIDAPFLELHHLVQERYSRTEAAAISLRELQSRFDELSTQNTNLASAAAATAAAASAAISAAASSSSPSKKLVHFDQVGWRCF